MAQLSTSSSYLFPSIIFLGICERARFTQEQNTEITKWDVIGLRNIVVLLNIFPIAFQGWFMGFALCRSEPLTEIKLRISDDLGHEVTILTITPMNVDESDMTAPHEDVISRQVLGSSCWKPTFVPVDDLGFVFLRSGSYFIEQILNEEYLNVGSFQLIAIDAPPMSLDRITALRSDPNAMQAIRIELGCKNCESKSRAYAALERNPKLENDNWVWYEELPDSFQCRCGNTTIDLQNIRRNFHGLLGKPYQNFEKLSFIPLYESSSLLSIRLEFSKLLLEEPREELLQQFLEQNPILLHQFPSERIIKKPPILTSYVADFGIVTPQRELILIEIEKATTRLMNRDGGLAAPLTHAFDQVRDWLHEIDEHRLAVLDGLGINRDEVSSVRAVVIAGRDQGYDTKSLRKLKGNDWGRVSFLTYDDLILALDALCRRFERL